MLRRHYMSNVVAADQVQEVDDAPPAKKRRKLADRLDRLIEAPKTTPVDSRLAFVGANDIVQQPIAGSSRDTTQPRRSPPLRRHNSLPTRASVIANEVQNHFGFPVASRSGLETVCPPLPSSSRSDLSFRSGTLSEMRQPPMSFMPSSVPRSDQHVSTASHHHPSHVSRPSHDSVPYSSINSTRVASPYLNVPGAASIHTGCSPACLTRSMQSSNPFDPFVGNSQRPCPSAAHMFPSFSAVGVVPAPVLAAEALPNYYGFLPGLSLPPSHMPYHTLPPYPVAQSNVATPPLITREQVDYILPPTAHSYPARHQTEVPRDVHHQPPPPYSLASSQVYLVDNVLRQSQSSPYSNLLSTVPFRQPHVDYRRRSDGQLPWSNVPMSNSALPLPSSHRPPVDPTQPLFVQHFLAMLETTLGAIHDSSHNHHPYTATNLHNYEALLGLARQLSENKPKGMSKADIDRLVTYQYATGDSDAKRQSGSSSETPTQTSCVVCMCDFTHRQRVRELPCQHIFHAKCIDKWLKTNRTCPLCRTDALDLLNSDEKTTASPAE